MSIRGRIVSFDAHMNVKIENAEELEDGELKTKLGTILLRGGNIIFVAVV
jgi:small nuclear ribonucleoprotein